MDGYALIQSRLRRTLDAEQIAAIASVGRPVDPERMNVVAVVETTDVPPGHVVDEVRRGYTWRGRVLRYAEVRAARAPRFRLPRPSSPGRRTSPPGRSRPLAEGGLGLRILPSKPRTPDRAPEQSDLTMETIIGIDLGTTNSEVAIVRDGQPVVLPGEDGEPILPSVVGLDPQGRLLVGTPARNQFALAPERTVRSIKRKMGQETTVRLGDRQYTPQEISAIILRTLKQRAERTLGQPVAKAVITVPAFFNEGQRDATREAGELAGPGGRPDHQRADRRRADLRPPPARTERLLVYDLGGGTFDVSIAQVEAGVVEILASHGDTQLGGDDFDDRLLLDHVCRRFRDEHGIDLREDLVARGRAPRRRGGQEDALRRGHRPGRGGVHRREGRPAAAPGLEIDRADYEELIEPLLRPDPDLPRPGALGREAPGRPDRQGGAGRRGDPHAAGPSAACGAAGPAGPSEIEPDLAVAMGAAVQGALIAGVDVGPVLVDITPHTLGIEALGVSTGCRRSTRLLADHRAEHPAAGQPDRDLLDGRRRPGGGRDPRLPGGGPGHAVQHPGRRVR